MSDDYLLGQTYRVYPAKRALSMADRALFAGYHRITKAVIKSVSRGYGTSGIHTKGMPLQMLFSARLDTVVTSMTHGSGL